MRKRITTISLSAALLTILIFLYFNIEKDRPTLRLVHYSPEIFTAEYCDSFTNEFERRYNCRLEIIEISEYRDKPFIAEIALAKPVPDLIQVSSEMIPDLAARGIVTFGKFDDKIFLRNKYKLLYINNDLLDRAMKNTKGKRNSKKKELHSGCIYDWDGLLHAAEIINDLDSVYGFGCAILDNRFYTETALMILASAGGTISADTNKLKVYSDTTAAMFELLKELINNSKIETRSQIERDFADGKIGICIADIYLSKHLRKVAADFNYSVCPIPSYRGNKGKTVLESDFLFISDLSENRDYAETLLNIIQHDSLVSISAFHGNSLEPDYYFKDYYKASQIAKFPEHKYKGKIINEFKSAVQKIIIKNYPAEDVLKNTQENIFYIIKTRRSATEIKKSLLE